MTSHLMPTFARVHLAFERGEGVWLTATDGERYLDFTSGVAVNALGHAHPHLVAALTEQAQKLWHVSNLFEIPESERAAQRLCEASFADVVFFCNSGAEAVEGAIKCARKYQSVNGAPERYRIVTFEGAFHGRTLATLAAGGQKKYLEGFGPVVEGFDQVPFGDLEAVKRAVGGETAAIMIEPLMGEGGVRIVDALVPRGAARTVRRARPPAYLRRSAERHGPNRRAVRLSAHRHHARHHVARQGAGRRLSGRRRAGDRGGGRGHDRRNPRLDLRRQSAGHERGQCDARCDARARLLRSRQADRRCCSSSGWRRSRTAIPSLVAEVRGEGLLVGLRMLVPAGELVDATRAEKMLTVGAGDNVVRLLPPLIISEQEIAEGVARLDRALARLDRAHGAKSRKQETAG